MFTGKYITKLRRFPVEPLLTAGTVLGILAAVRSWYFALGLILLLFFPKRNIAAALLFFLLGSASALWQIPREAAENVYGKAKFIITDLRLSQMEGIAAPSLISAEIIEFQPTGDVIRPHREKTFLRLPYGSTVKPPPGTVCYGEGLLAAPTTDGFANYLYARKVKRTFQLDKIEIRSTARTWRYHLAALRDILLKRTLSGIDAPEIRRLAAGLFFNAGGGLSRADKEQYLRSGTIHIFSVSGMHVAMLAALLFMLLHPLPGKWREITVLVILTLYVFSTGANPPALRALGMIGIFLILRLFLLQTPPIRILTLIAAVLLSVSPGLLFDIGFLYSFIITAALLLGVCRLRDGKRVMRASVLLTRTAADRLQVSRHTRPLELVMSTVGISLISFCGGLAISVCSRGLFLPGSVIANILLLPLVPFLFIFGGFKLLFGWLPLLNHAGAFLLTSGFRLLDAITGMTAALLESMPVIRPHLWEAVFFYAALFLLLAVRHWRIRLAAMTAVILLTVSWAVRPLLEKPFVALLSSDAGTPLMVIEAFPAVNRAMIYDVPSSEMGYMAAELLSAKGITRTEFVRFTNARSDHSRGIKALTSQMPVERLELPPQSRKGFVRNIHKELPNARLQPYSKRQHGLEIRRIDTGWEIKINGQKHITPFSQQVQKRLIVKDRTGLQIPAPASR